MRPISNGTQGGWWRRYRTLVVFFGTSLGYTLTCFTQTLDPSRVPSYTSSEPPMATGQRPTSRTEGERMYEVGSIILVPHMPRSSHGHFRKQGLVWSRLPRAYDDSSGGGEMRHDGIPCPDSQQAILNRHLEGSARIVYTLHHLACY